MILFLFILRTWLKFCLVLTSVRFINQLKRSKSPEDTANTTTSVDYLSRFDTSLAEIKSSIDKLQENTKFESRHCVIPYHIGYVGKRQVSHLVNLFNAFLYLTTRLYHL